MKSIVHILLPVFLVISGSAIAADKLSLSDLKGSSVLGGPLSVPDLRQKKGLVAIFLSAVCPCSNSHIKELKDLASQYSDFQFVGIHSNTDEGPEMTKKYFETAALPFTVIQDEKAQIADAFGALKTPHAFIVAADGKVLYQGGVSNSHDLDRSDRKFLREALGDLKENRPVKTREGRTLGCAISRGEKHVW